MISVIVPVYNTKQYLVECIQSICKQTYQEIEMIAVDDGSTDGSSELLDAIAENDTRIRVLHKTNGGVSAARNAGLEIAQGDYISFVDSDDTVEPDMYETLLDVLHDYGGDISHCSYNRMSSTEIRPIGGSGKVLAQTGTEAQELLLRGKLFTGSLCTKLFRRSLFEHICLNESLKINEDVLAVFQLFQQANTAIFIDVCKYNYRTSETSSCARTDRLRKSRDCVKAAEIMRAEATEQRIKVLAEERILGCLLGYYREMLFCGYHGNQAERKSVTKQIKELVNHGTYVSQKKRFEYCLMRRAPYCYMTMYRIYDRMRKPNWDISDE